MSYISFELQDEDLSVLRTAVLASMKAVSFEVEKNTLLYPYYISYFFIKLLRNFAKRSKQQKDFHLLRIETWKTILS